MGMPQTIHWTAEHVRALPDDGQRHEVVDGELLVTPAPSWRHQAAVGELYRRIAHYLAADRVGAAILAPADIELDPRTLVQPDLFVVPLHDGRRPASWVEAGRLLLVVEVLSPSSARADRQVKRRRYQRAGVAEYWIVDVDGRLVERWRPGDTRPEIAGELLEWQPEGARDAFAIELPALFAEVIDGAI